MGNRNIGSARKADVRIMPHDPAVINTETSNLVCGEHAPKQY